MNELTDALLLKDTASRGKVAVTYGIVDLLVGVLVFNRSST